MRKIPRGLQTVTVYCTQSYLWVEEVVQGITNNKDNIMGWDRHVPI